MFYLYLCSIKGLVEKTEEIKMQKPMESFLQTWILLKQEILAQKSI